MSELISASVSVDGLLVGLILGVVWLWFAPRAPGPRLWLTALLVLYLTLSVHAAVRLISAPLRRGFHTFSVADAPPSPRAIVLLGAGARTVHGNVQAMGVLTLDGAARVLEAVRVF